MLSGHVCAFFFTGNLHFAYVEVGDETTSRSARYACYLKNSVLDVKYPGSYTRLFVSRGSLHELLALLWSPYVIGQTIIFLPCDFYLSSSSSFFPSPNLSGRRLDVYHTSTHGVALVQI